MEGSSSTYPLVLDLSSPGVDVEAVARGVVDPDRIARELKDISDRIAPVLAEPQPSAGLGLASVEVSLTIGAEGGVWFIAKGSAEASITLTFSRPG
jgi:hypothetical protein